MVPYTVWRILYMVHNIQDVNFIYIFPHWHLLVFSLTVSSWWRCVRTSSRRRKDIAASPLQRTPPCWPPLSSYVHFMKCSSKVAVTLTYSYGLLINIENNSIDSIYIFYQLWYLIYVWLSEVNQVNLQLYTWQGRGEVNKIQIPPGCPWIPPPCLLKKPFAWKTK